MVTEGADVVWIHVELSAFSIFYTERPQSLAQQLAAEFPACKKLVAPGAPVPRSHRLPKLPVKPSGKLERLCTSPEHPFHLKLSTTRAVTELNIETNNNQ